MDKTDVFLTNRKSLQTEDFSLILSRTKDWNAVFQRIVELPDSATKFRSLSRVAKEFGN
jgi:hypothetical protein